MTVNMCDYNQRDWIRHIEKTLHSIHEEIERKDQDHNRTTELVRDLQRDAMHLGRVCLAHWLAATTEASLRTEKIAQDCIFNQENYNLFCEEARALRLELVLLVEVSGGGYRGPAVQMALEPIYNSKDGTHPIFKVRTLRRKFNGGWVLYPEYF